MDNKRLRTSAARACALLCALMALFFLSACSSGAQTLQNVQILAELQPDGSLKITQQVTYPLVAGVQSVSHSLEAQNASDITDISVTGSFAWGQQVKFKQKDSAVLGDNAALVVRATDKQHVLLTLYHPFAQEDASVTLTYRYTLHGVATRYADAGTFTWEPMGSKGWGATIAQWSARVIVPALPTERTEVALLHAPASAKLERVSGGVMLSAASVKAGSYASIRLDFPPEILLYMPVHPGPQLATLRAQATAVQTKRDLLGYGWAGLCALTALGLGLWFFLRKDHDPKLLPSRMRQGPALGITAPAELSTLVPMAGGVGHRDVVAMLLHLIHRNHLALLPPEGGLPLTQETMDQARLIRLPAPRDTLLDGEFFLIHWFIDTMGDGKTVTLGQVRRTHRDHFASDYRVWRQLVDEQIAQRPWFRDLRKQRRMLGALGGLMLLGAPVVLAFGALPIAWVGAVVGLATVAFALRIRRRTTAADIELQHWHTLREQLLTGQVYGASTIAQWERILLYAEAMGMSAQAAAAMQNAVNAEVEGEAPSWPDASEATFMAWPLLEYAGKLSRWFELFCQAILPVR